MSELESLLATAAVFKDLTPEELREIARVCREARYKAGTVILNQGEYSDALYVLRSGRLTVKVRKGGRRETVAHLDPPAIFGELAFVTGRANAADVEAVADADVVCLDKPALSRIERLRDKIVDSMASVFTARKPSEPPVILLRNLPHWEAPKSFAVELAKSLSRQTSHETLLVHLSGGPDAAPRPLSNRAFECTAAVDSVDARRLAEWRTRFTNVILSPAGSVAGHIEALANSVGVLAGPGDPVPDAADENGFIVQSATAPTLPALSGNRQLIWDAAESERAHAEGRPALDRFIRTVDSIARSVLRLQVGIALGGGAAWGWAHIGLLEQFEKAGLPADMIAGSSMGAVVGALYCSGSSILDIFGIAEHFRTRKRGFIESRVWKMTLISDKVATKVLTSYFGDRLVNRMAIPFWANAVDVKTGHEFTIQDGPVVDCLRASVALPGLLPAVERGDRLLVDALIKNPVPVDLVRRMGASYVVAVNATAPLESPAVSKRFPVFDIIFRCLRIIVHELGQLRAEESADVMITPDLGDIAMLDFDRSPEIVECGRKAAEVNLPAIMAGYERMKNRTYAEMAEVAPKIN